MRTVSLINRLKWSFSGNMNPHALVLGDVDNDNDVEFVIGNLHGSMAIFKGECPSGHPTFVCQDLGTITCVAVGDVRNIGKNSIVIVNAEGHCYIFDVPTPICSEPTLRQPIVEEFNRQGRRQSDTTSLQSFRRWMYQTDDTHNTTEDASDLPNTNQPILPSLSLNVPINVNKILIADIDGDGMNEMILARTDRILHSFQLDHLASGSLSPSTQPPTIPGSPSAVTLTSTIQSSLSVLSGHKLGSKVFKATSKTPSTPPTKEQAILREKGMWVFDGQITAMTLSHVPDKPDEPILLVAQPGNSFTIIDQHGHRLNSDFTPQTTTQMSSTFQPHPTAADQDEQDTTLHTMRTLQPKANPSKGDKKIQVDPVEDDDKRPRLLKRRSYSVQDFEAENILGQDKHGAVATEIVIGKLHEDGPESGRHVGMLSLDGNFTIYDLKTKEIASQDLLVTHKLFSLGNLDVKHGAQLPSRRSYSRTPSQATSPAIGRHFPHFSTPAAHSPASSSKAHATLAATTTNATATQQPNGNNGGSALSSRSPSISSLKRTKVSSTSSPAITDDDHASLRFPSQQPQPIPTSGNRDRLASVVHRDSRASSISGVSTTGWSDIDEPDEAIANLDRDLFVACAWNGVTYLIDWSQSVGSSSHPSSAAASPPYDDVDFAHRRAQPDTPIHQDALADRSSPTSNIKFQVIKFAFEGRVCAFTAGMYAVMPGYNVPCLVYVDFEDQIFVYYDIHLRPGPVNGFMDVMDDDIEEAMDRWMGLELELDQQFTPGDYDNGSAVDLGDGWQGIMADILQDDGHVLTNISNLDMTELVHDCLYNFEDIKEQLDQDLFMFEHQHLPRPLHADMLKLSDLNITIEPNLESGILINVETDEQGDDDDGKSTTLSTDSSLSNDSEIRQWVNDNMRTSTGGSSRHEGA
ncbi:hypothetical protein DM01DRAFT_1337483 [Hesseltinella vesiculosa]|uniref:Uncharacterized protein n=1 Tax=Hesseltinella vesiculosa TaxID=101127 RepID=A0A1X2GCT8_9FUNG|nr:hypothetical protein DM01DRAFT_1337483 [Hesseltinella vesiculosa]